MIPRYALPEMTAVWSDERKFELWLKVEVAAVQAWGDEERVACSGHGGVGHRASLPRGSEGGA